MRFAILLIFSGIDQDDACDMLLPQMRFDTNARLVIFHGLCVCKSSCKETCFAVVKRNDISHVLRQRCVIGFCVKLGKK
jgi:hypothetical protein